MKNYKPNIYIKGKNPELDADFVAAAAYSKVKPGRTAVFWKSGLRWYYVPMEQVQRIFRRVETVNGKMCCGAQTFVIEWLVLILHDGTEVVMHIGDDVQEKAKALLQALKDAHPQIQYGKV